MKENLIKFVIAMFVSALLVGVLVALAWGISFTLSTPIWQTLTFMFGGFLFGKNTGELYEFLRYK